VGGVVKRKRSAVAVTLAVCALLAGAGAATLELGANGAAARVRRPATRGVSGARAIQFTLVLRLPGAARLRRRLTALEDPRSRSFRKFIAPAQFGSRFGLSRGQLASLARRLHRAGLRTTASYPQRTELGVSATAATVERLFRVRLLAYGSAYAPAGTPTISRGFAPMVQAVTGLDTRRRLVAHDVPYSGLTPSLTVRAYDVSALRDAGFNGHGLKIAVISFSAFDPSDPQAFARQYGLAGPAPKVISVDGGTSDQSGADEANLDIDVIRSIAPAAQILIYEAPPTSGAYADVISRIVADHQTSIISSSWGLCELGLDPQEHLGDTRALSAAVADGVSMFVATGDSGAYDCQQGDLTDHRLSVDWPASSADAVAVGGTRLYISGDGAYEGEAAWEDQLSDAGGGGGFSRSSRRPAWQAGPGVSSPYSDGYRQLPDVSADADPGTPWSFYWGGQLRRAGGTSAAAPFWAASSLLIEQYAAAHRVGRIGYVNPILYALANSRQPAPPFHDVTRGGNRYYQATPGWDPATGLGSPYVYNLARDIVAYLRRHR
jgi:kumamolisin